MRSEIFTEAQIMTVYNMIDEDESIRMNAEKLNGIKRSLVEVFLNEIRHPFASPILLTTKFGMDAEHDCAAFFNFSPMPIKSKQGSGKKSLILRHKREGGWEE